MVRGVCWLAVLGLVWAAGAGRAQETYAIKLKEGGKGQRHKVEKRSAQKFAIALAGAQGNPVPAQDEATTERFVYEETILERPDPAKKPTRLRRRYEVAQVKKGGDARTLPYEGKTVDIRKADGRYRFRVEGGGELAGQDAEALDREFNKRTGEDFDFNKAMLPKKPVRVAETWKPDTAALVADLQKQAPVEIDAARAKATATLVKAYKKDGRQFGVIKMTLDFPLKGLRQGGKLVPFGAGQRLTIVATMDGCIDGSLLDGGAAFTGRMAAQFDLDLAGQKLKVSAKMSMEGEEKDKELGPK